MLLSSRDARDLPQSGFRRSRMHARARALSMKKKLKELHRVPSRARANALLRVLRTPTRETRSHISFFFFAFSFYSRLIGVLLNDEGGAFLSIARLT